MARFAIDKATTRAKLCPRSAPYWGAPIATNLYVGFRLRSVSAPGTWIARALNDDKEYRFESLGTVSPENNYEQARKAALAWHRQLLAGINTSEVATVFDACADYVRSLRQDKRVRTADDAARRFERMINADPLGKVRLSKIRQHHLEAWRERMEKGEYGKLLTKRGRSPNSRPMSPAAFKRNLTALKAALNFAVTRRYISPERQIEWMAIRPAKDSSRRRELYLDRNQRSLLLNSAKGNIRDIIECVALTGCRPGDPAVMLRRDYDDRTGSATFSTKEHRRTVEVSPTARALFDRLAKGKKPDDHMFLQDNNRPWTTFDWCDAVREAVTTANLPKETVLYTIRHSWITDAIVGGLDLLTVARLVGTSVVMIERHYGHLSRTAARDKLAKLDFI